MSQNRAEQDIQTHYRVATARLGSSGWLVAADPAKPEKAEGTIVPFAFDNGTGWVGYFCVNAPYQGLGWGAALFSQCLKEFEKGGATTVGLDAVKEQVGTYERRGFVDVGRTKLFTRQPLNEQSLQGGFEHVQTDGERLVPLEEVPSSVLVESDLAITGFKRGKLWSKEALFEHRDDSWGLALVSEGASAEKDRLDGWILVRSCEHGFRVGPLYAEKKEDAAFLLHQALYRLQAEPGSLIAEVWGGNKEAVGVFEEAGWKWLEIDYHRMWLNGKVPGEQKEGGRAEREMWAVFDAGQS
jgi:GNAT superfamily N-acetyltransferase